MPDLYAEKKSLLPPSYVEFIETNNGWEGDLGEQFGYIVIWNKETIQDRWVGYEMQKYLDDRWFPFGSDGGGEMFCFDLHSKGDGVFMLPFIGMSDEEAIAQYESFSDIACIIRGNH